jgi:uncharacterized membrane protein SirB2
MYRIHWDKHRPLQYASRAWARILPVMFDHVLCADGFTVLAILNPRILTSV